MSFHIKDQTIPLGKFIFKNISNVNFSLFASKADDMVKPWFLDHSNSFKTFRCTYQWSLIVIGSYFRYIVYKQLFKSYQKKEFSHIEVLLTILISIQHLNMMMYLFSTALMMATDASYPESLGYVAGTCFCNIHMLLYRFDALYKYIGGLGIALYRILLITCPNLVEFRIGKKLLFYLILYGGLIVTFCSFIFLYLHDYSYLFMTECIHPPKRLLLESLDEYEQSRGEPSIYSVYLNARIYLGILDLFCVVSTMTIYVIFFRFCYKHDNNENLKLLLEPEVIRRRNKRNAITFFGQFCSFVLQLIVITVFMMQAAMSNSENQLMDIFLILRTTLFFGMAVTEVFTSKRLRSQLFGGKQA